MENILNDMLKSVLKVHFTLFGLLLFAFWFGFDFNRIG